MSMSIVLRDDEYLIRADDGTESDSVPYGDCVELEHGGKTYVAFMDMGDDGNPATVLPSGYALIVGKPVNVEWVEEYEGESEEEEGEDLGDEDEQDGDDDSDDGEDSDPDDD